MGIRSFFGFTSSEGDTMGPVGSDREEEARREYIEATGHASPGYVDDREDMVTMPNDKRPRRR